MADMSDINVIYQFNEKYVPYAGVSITSLFINNTDADAINVYVLGDDLSEESVTMLQRTADKYGRNVIFPKTQEMLNRFKDLGMIPYRGTYSVYLRLFFTKLPGVDLAGKRAVYLDADTIVDKSLAPLAEHDLGGKSIGMVLESIRDDYKVMIGMSRDSDYYNSGVILFDVDKWESNGYCDRLVEHIRNVRSSYIGDQDFLNIVCEGDVCRLPITYNFQPLHARYTADEYFAAYKLRDESEYYCAGEIESAKHDASILHCYRWLGEFPWNFGNLHPFNDVYDRYMAQSLWKGFDKKRADSGIVIRLEKLLYRVLPKSMFIRIFKLAHKMMLQRAEADARAQKTNADA